MEAVHRIAFKVTRFQQITQVIISLCLSEILDFDQKARRMEDCAVTFNIKKTYKAMN